MNISHSCVKTEKGFLEKDLVRLDEKCYFFNLKPIDSYWGVIGTYLHPGIWLPNRQRIKGNRTIGLEKNYDKPIEEDS